MPKNLLDPITNKSFLKIRRLNGRLKMNKQLRDTKYKQLSLLSGIPVSVLRAAASGNQEAFMLVASSEMSNKNKNLVLSNAVGRVNETTEVKGGQYKLGNASYSAVPVGATMCTTEGNYPSIRKYFNNSTITPLRYKTIRRRVPISNVDFSDVDQATSYGDLFVLPIDPLTAFGPPEPVDANSYVKYFNL